MCVQDSRKYAILAAAFFLVHPIQTEAVTYISSRSELLSTFFYLTGFLLFIYWPDIWPYYSWRGFLCAFCVGIPYFFAIGSKETALTLPAAILLYDYLFLAKCSSRSLISRWRFYMSYMIAGAAAAYYIAFVALRGSIGASLPGHISSWHYFLTENRVIVRYIRLIFWPTGLNLDYDFPPSTGLDLAVIGSLLLLTGCITLGWIVRRRAPVFSFSIFWFFITLAPTSSVVSILDVIFEHRLYLPLVGASLSFPYVVAFFYKKWQIAFASLILIALLAGSVQRNYVWSDEIRIVESSAWI